MNKVPYLYSYAIWQTLKMLKIQEENGKVFKYFL
jgi:hypothetical protein